MLQGLKDARASAQAWEQQAAEALARVELLKEMLGEGVDWQVLLGGTPAAQGQQPEISWARTWAQARAGRQQGPGNADVQAASHPRVWSASALLL